MRNIKFRAWDRFAKEMVFAKTIDFGTNGAERIVDSDGINGDVGGEWDLEQFTGLHDKNGNEIYEGDIVNCSEGCPHKIIWVQEHGGMFFGGMPGWYLSGLKDGYAWGEDEELIGNIHENPELLEGAKDGKGLNDSKHVNSIYAEGNTSDVESSTNELNDLQKFYWTTKKNDNYENVMHLKRDPSGSIERVPYAFHGENERLTEQEVIDEGYNPDYYVKEEVE